MPNDHQKGAESFILCELAGTSYAVPSRLVLQLEMVEHVTPVPNASPAVEGIVLSRGQVIPALNLRARFGFERTPYDLRTRLVIVNVEGRTVGLIVDTAREFVSIARDAIEPPPDAVAGLNGNYLEGVVALGDRLVFVLDVAELTRVSGEVDRTEGAP